MGIFKINNVILSLGILYTCFSFSQEVSFSVKEVSFCTSVNDEFAPTYYRNGLVFCSNSISNTSIKNEDGKLFNILYVESRDSVEWENPELFSKELTTLLNEGPSTFKPNNLTIFYARNNIVEGKFKDINNPSNTMGIYFAEFKDGFWGNIQAFPYNSSEYSIGTPFLSSTGLRIYFASDMPGGFGGTDLYYSDFFSGDWQEPVNLGQVVNSRGNESYPFINEYGLLFFSSDGFPGFGGKDIFYTAQSNGKWQLPIHLDADINSASDDYGLITDMNFEKGFFSSNRKHSDDIYSFKSERPQFGYCDTLYSSPQCFVFYDDRFTDTLHLEYEWNFGKGIVKKGYRVEHCFNNPGKHEVLLTIVHNLADSVFETKIIHRFELENSAPVFINSDKVIVANTLASFDAIHSNFNEFEVIQSYWDFGNGFLQNGTNANYSFRNSGDNIVSYGLEGPKDNYGRVPRKCYTKLINVVSDFQALSMEYKSPLEKIYSGEELSELSSLLPEDKNGQETYRVDFSILSSKMSLLGVDILEQSLSEFSNNYVQIVNGELTENSVRTIVELLNVINNYQNDSLVIAIHKNKKGNSKSIQQSTDLLASKIEQLIEENDSIDIKVLCIGYGDNRPMVRNKNDYAQYLNQRIEFIVYSPIMDD